ncbi:phosphonate ABC transporter ATP-binding protein [Hyphobacterium marinum]|uniref:Phosphonate ABC transporter ATP-binding protein n=1 Tax=Hyphobacterium marinum TaxID=3116574 RepID=A0ABU7LXP1_9PROT|nr:phosphonate ABC transporter ATP-binding protein [Hyphobacterium sp. Y6023]MEE2565770.1 phosphonate ABC transporter ATP-binding protein [Hyphobacterium sp. Y6023]
MTEAIPALEIHDATKTYGPMRAISNVSLSVERGEMVALIGPSGSGKSTLLRAASGLVVADTSSGPIRIFGDRVQEAGKLSRGVRRARSQVGFIFQQFNLVKRISLYANVLLGALGRMPGWKGALGRFSTEDRKKAMEALERVGVIEHAGKRASDLSGGQQQRGAIARAMVQGAQAIFADEPIASLDPVSARNVMQLLSELNSQDGITVVVTLHQVDYALKYCERAVALKDGHVIYDGPTSGLTRTRLIEIYGDEYIGVLDEEGATS